MRKRGSSTRNVDRFARDKVEWGNAAERGQVQLILALLFEKDPLDGAEENYVLASPLVNYEYLDPQVLSNKLVSK